MSHYHDSFYFFLERNKIKYRNICCFFLLLDLKEKMSSEHVILADSIKKVHQELRHDVNQSTYL